MTEKEIKKAYSDVEKELSAEKERQIKEQVRGIVKVTLEKMEKLKERKSKIDKELKILKMDIDDLKEGHLDRIKERQEKDPDAKQISVIIIKEKEIIKGPYPSPWYRPYEITWSTNDYPDTNTVYCDNGTANNMLLNTTSAVNSVPCSFTLNNSAAKDNAIGTYKLKTKIIHLR